MKCDLNQAVGLIGIFSELQVVTQLGQETIQGEVVGFTMFKNQDFEFIVDSNQGLEVYAADDVISLTNLL